MQCWPMQCWPMQCWPMRRWVGYAVLATDEMSAANATLDPSKSYLRGVVLEVVRSSPAGRGMPGSIAGRSIASQYSVTLYLFDEAANASPLVAQEAIDAVSFAPGSYLTRRRV